MKIIELFWFPVKVVIILLVVGGPVAVFPKNFRNGENT